MNDPNRPDDPAYYADVAYQQWDISYSLWGPPALLSQSLKYIMRAGRKSSSSMLRDVRNAINYLKHLEEKLVAEENKTSPGVSER